MFTVSIDVDTGSKTSPSYDKRTNYDIMKKNMGLIIVSLVVTRLSLA